MASLFKRGKKWYITWHEDGQRKMKSTKTVDKQLAMEALRKFEEEKTRIDLGLEPVVKIQPIMLSQFIEVYQEDRRRIGRSKQTITIDMLALRGLLKFTGDCKLETVSTNTALRFRDHLLARVKSATASIRLRAIRSAFSWASDKPGERYHRFNPFAQKRIIPAPEKRKLPICLSPAEKIRLFNAIEDQDHRNLFSFFALTGCRRSEAVNLQWSDIDYKSHQIVIRQSKTGKEIVIPISLELIQVLKSLDLSKPKPFNYKRDWITHLFERYRKKADLPTRFHLHCLRHTAAVEMIRKGIHLQKVSQMLGHESVTTTEIYTRLLPEDLRDAAEALTCIG
ncbi:tyrosine-type recombinase/integrase [bacterium]|nr:tyrosine-type recombinase/integrase [bacterium]